MDKDLYANKLLLSFFTSLYLVFSNKPHLCFAILIVLYQNKRDIVSLGFTLACALIKEYTLFPFYLFFLILTLKNIPINILLVILYAYFNKFNYINYLPIIINFLLYHKGTKPNAFSQTKELVNNYLAILSAKSKNLDSYDIINSKIKNLITSYCLNCSMKDSCLGKRRIDLYHYLMFESTKNMKQSKEIDYFIYNCEYKKMMDEVPKVEFGTVSNYHILKDSFNIILSEDEKKSRIINKLKSYSLKNVVYKNEDELVLSFDEYLPPLKLKRILNDKNYSVIYKGKNQYDITPHPIIKAKAESIILSKGGGYIAGDNCMIKKTTSKLYAALSDGMGTGLKAYEASKALLKRLEALISLPYSDERIIRLLTELTHVSLYTSSYSTLDFISIDLTQKKANLFKVASSTTLLLRDNKIIEYKTKTLPIDFDSVLDLYEIDLKKNDIILLMSDGAYDYINIKALYSYILSISYLDPDKLVYDIAKYIFIQSNKKLKDDTSILGIKIY